MDKKIEIKNLFNLKGKTALVTGGSQGIGRAISLALAEYGANLVIVYRSEQKLAEQIKLEIQSFGVTCHLIKSDLSNTDAPETIVSILNEYYLKIDILVLNASVQIRNSWDNVSYEEYDFQMRVNFAASLFLIQKLYPNMCDKNWGRILTIGSVQQIRPHQEMLVYAASKMAQLSMVKSLAPQFGLNGVTINNMAPGAISTIRNEEVLSNKKYRKLVESKIPIGFIGEARDCASMALLLCSNAGRYITGQDMFVDGGMGLNF
ncbi:SDR family oxidoreductase [Aurantibacter sp.]|uniref:SDR family NAD(P)-dependent oxidoreductase n=1 Tax=Aurantibacter sp. TaxID=2807103 RepID=UPI003263EB98